MNAGSSSNAPAARGASMRFGEWSDGEWVVIAHEGDEGEQLPQILQEIEIESLQLFVHAPGDQQHDELNGAKHEQHPESEPGEHGEAQRIEQPDDRKWRPRSWLRNGAVGRMCIGHDRRSLA